jgi:hypothetical protein
MKVDRKHLWVFTRKFIACATHASVKRFCQEVKGKNGMYAKIDWAYYDIPADLGGDWKSGGKFDGLHDLSPCDDGTLVAIFSDKRKQRIYRAKPVINHLTSSIRIIGVQQDYQGRNTTTNGWELAGEDEAHRVYKQPIFCWFMLERLSEILSRSEAVKAIAA